MKNILAKKLNVFIPIFTFLIVASIVLMFFEEEHWVGLEEEETITDKFINRFYFMTNMITTVGHGDITPRSNVLKVLVVSMMLIAYIGLLERILNYIYE